MLEILRLFNSNTIKHETIKAALPEVNAVARSVSHILKKCFKESENFIALNTSFFFFSSGPGHMPQIHLSL
jgi:hypothetical protein